MTYSPNLSEQQSQFLQTMATQFNFGGDMLTLFLNRFDKTNRNQSNIVLATKISWIREVGHKTEKLQYELANICQVLEDNGCPIPDKLKPGRPPKGKIPWEHAYKWLWDTKFIEWQRSRKELAQPVDIDDLVNQVREKVSAYIQKRCGLMRVWDMTQPIAINDIYTDANILEKITGSKRPEKLQRLENCNPENFERFELNQIKEKQVPGLKAVEKHSKLMILGKPGAGKTTFLKRIAIQCKSGEIFADHVPIFITLKDFAEALQQPTLLQYINDLLALNDISDPEITKTLLSEGWVILLLDGLDEVKEEDNDRVLREIRNFSIQYNANRFVITCRIASKEYTFEQFTEVEVADFEDKQIAEFANKWFQTKDPKKAEQFIQKLQQNQPIQELATNPLLLTLLCLVFEELTDFPSNRFELYQEWVEVLLKKWDSTRSIEREQIYHKLSLKRKEDLLSRIALITFESGNYFFKERQAEEYINDYIQNLPDAQTDPEAQVLDSKAILKSIEAQHGLLVERARGIYSFSHLTFHEFFAAKNIASSPNPQEAFEQLVSHITDKHWREIFLLTLESLNEADDLLKLMKKKIDELLAGDEKLQQFLTWINEKSCSVETHYKSTAVRAFYLDLSLDLSFSLTLNRYISLSFSFSLDRSLKIDLYSDRISYFDSSLDRSPSIARSLDLFLDLSLSRTLCLDLSSNWTLSLDLALNRFFDLSLDLKLKRLLQQLKDQLPPRSVDERESFMDWWRKNGQAWAKELRALMIKHRNIGHDWQFNDDQKQLLKQYHDANKFLVDCLNSQCSVSSSVRQEIENTLLLPENRNEPLVSTIP